MSVTINGTTGLVFNDASTQTTAATGFGFKNRIINGAMVIDQRNAGAAVTVTDAYTTDRWEVREISDGAVSAQQVSDAPTGLTKSLRITVTTADSVLAAGDILRVSQMVEGQNCSDFSWGSSSAQSVAASFSVKSSVTGTFVLSIRNSANDRSYLATYTVNAANTWEQKTIAIPGDVSGTWLTTNGIGLRFEFILAAGSDYLGTAGSWAAGDKRTVSGATSLLSTLSATWQVTGVQLEKGSTATSFDYRPYGTELALCQRYYYRLYGPNNYVGNGFSYATTSSYARVQFPVTMRAAPSALEQSGTASHYLVVYNATQITCTSVPSFENATVNGAMSTFTASGGPAIGTSTLPQISSASGYLGWSAEL